MLNKIKDIDQLLDTIKKNIDELQSKIEDEIYKRPTCCKAGVEASQWEARHFDDRIRHLEERLLSKETINDDGARVISVIVPNIEDVPSAIAPLGSSGKYLE
jgi:peptidoglycan hydrolase CwlO-like protein